MKVHVMVDNNAGMRLVSKCRQFGEALAIRRHADAGMKGGRSIEVSLDVHSR
jgi:hypothetical protein